MPAGIHSAAHDDQNQNHGHCNSNQAAASAAVSPATAAIVVVPTAAGRTAEVAVECRHVIPAIIFQWKTCFSCSNPPVHLIQ